MGLHDGSLSNFLSTVDIKVDKTILWADYDFLVNDEMIQDIRTSVAQAPSGSMIIVTADVQPDSDWTSSVDAFERFSDEASLGMDSSWTAADFRKEHIERRSIDIIWKAFDEGMKLRSEGYLTPVLCISYKDSHRMITIGAMIAENQNRQRAYRRIFNDLPFCLKNRSNRKSRFEISAPVITKNERFLLDRSVGSTKPDIPEFLSPIISAEEFQILHRYIPTFAEILID
jgi:hypothetical protein